jgi:hypothetical protein
VLQTNKFLWMLTAPMDEWEKAVILQALFPGDDEKSL